MGTFKLMARLFHAFDRQHYQELSGVHLADMWQLPPAVLQHLRTGAFTASVRGIATRNEALDEVHESTVNRQLKAVLHRTDPLYIEQNAHYLSFRSVVHENLRDASLCQGNQR